MVIGFYENAPVRKAGVNWMLDIAIYSKDNACAWGNYFLLARVRES